MGLEDLNANRAISSDGTLSAGAYEVDTFETVESRRSLDRSSPLPLWSQLYADLRSRMESHEFDDEFPGEMALVQQYGVSRNTVREAMRRMRSDGLVIAERGRRPRLGSESEIMQPLGALYSLFTSVEAQGKVQRSLVKALEIRTDAEVATHLSLNENAPLLYLERVRLVDSQPLAIDRVWFPAELAEPLLNADFTHTGFYDELATRVGLRLSGGKEHIYAVEPSEEEKHLLEIGPNIAMLAIERIGFMKDTPVEWRYTLVRGDRFSFVAEFSAGLGYKIDIFEQGETHLNDSAGTA